MNRSATYGKTTKALWKDKLHAYGAYQDEDDREKVPECDMKKEALLYGLYGHISVQNNMSVMFMICNQSTESIKNFTNMLSIIVTLCLSVHDPWFP
ncbi:hypothetical protein ACF0H5_021278 [Mactra antiquata]